MSTINDAEGYWSSTEGLLLRLDMLAGSISTGTYNNAIQVTASVYGVQYFKVAGPEPKCPYCIQYYGKIYRQGQFTPEFPAHPNCPHLFDVYFPWQEESSF
jgi:hypothetical protein